MALFVLDTQPEFCAQYMSDQHIRSMPHEYRRVLLGYIPGDDLAECVWYSLDNYEWLRELVFYIDVEYRWRFRHGHHKVARRAYKMRRPTDLDSNGFTVPPVLVPRRYQDPDPVLASRRYYWARKRSGATWTHRPTPWFMQQRLELDELAA